jgi:hypothetical protein
MRLQVGLYKGVTTLFVVVLRIILRLTCMRECERFHELQPKQRGPLEPEVRVDGQKKCTSTRCVRRIAVWGGLGHRTISPNANANCACPTSSILLDVRTVCDHRLFVKCLNTLPDFRGEKCPLFPTLITMT